MFLWAHTVAEDLREASKHGDDEADLWLRLEQCPTEMHQLLEHLLQRQDPFYTKGTKPCLRLIEFNITNNRNATLFDVFIASQPQEDFASIMSGQAWDAYTSTINADAANFETNVVARCAGLVELYPLYSCESLTQNIPYANLRHLDNMRAEFMHRSAQDYLLECSGTTSSLLPPALSNDEAASRFMGAELLKSLIRPRDGGYHHMPLTYASMVSQAGWTPRETALMDLWFEELSTYLPSLRTSQSEEESVSSRETWPPDLPRVKEPEVTSPDLSRKDDLIFGVTAVYKLAAYNNVKAGGLTSDRLMVILVMMYCNATRSKMDNELETYSPFLGQPLQPMLKICLNYESMASESEIPVPAISSTCYIWEHLEIARIAEYFRRQSLDIVTNGFSAPSLSTEAIDENQILRTRGLAMGYPGELKSLIVVPVPDDWCDEKVQEWDVGLVVFEFQLVLRASQLGLRNQYFEPQFLRWKMAGTTRLFDLTKQQSHALYAATEELNVGLVIEDWYIDNVVAAWNNLLPEAPPQETAQILDRHRLSGSSLVFEAGEVLIADGAEYWEWRQDLTRHRNELTDPVLVEYLKITTMSPLEEFAKALEQCAAERHARCICPD